MSQLCVNDIFVSIDGEVTKWGQGGLSTFIRFQGCNLRCPICDTPQSIPRGGGSTYFPDSLYKEVEKRIGWNKRVTITGGEPFLQDVNAMAIFLTLLNKKSYYMTIETNGTIDIPDYVFEMDNASIILDLKVFDPDLLAAVNPHNLNRLRKANDFVKVVVGRDISCLTRNLTLIQILASTATIAFAPLMRPDNTFYIDPKAIVDFMVKNGIQGVLNLQLHKFAQLV